MSIIRQMPLIQPAREPQPTDLEQQARSRERSDLISELLSDFDMRADYIKSKVTTLVPSQIRGLRLKSDTPRQPDLAEAAKMHQSRISMLETPGTNPTIGTLSEIAAALKVGLKVEFVPFSEMLAWENSFSQDQFYVPTIDNDIAFLSPAPSQIADFYPPVPVVEEHGVINTFRLTLEVMNDLQEWQLRDRIALGKPEVIHLHGKYEPITGNWANIIYGREASEDTLTDFGISKALLASINPPIPTGLEKTHA